MNTTKRDNLKLDTLRLKLRGKSGPQYWRSLEQLADSQDFRAFVENEFGPHWLPEPGHMGRRKFLALAAASLALAGLTGCEQPREPIVPYVRRPEDLLPGRPRFFATAQELDGCGTGLLVKSHMGRPIKIEGNAQHPDSLGAASPFAMAEILSLYDPDRSQVIRFKGQIATWDGFVSAVRRLMDSYTISRGRGLRVLSEPVISPTLAAQRSEFLTRFPHATWHQYTPAARDAERAGLLAATGRDLQPRHHLEHADIVVSLDADFLVTGPGHLRHARHFSRRRDPEDERGMNRLYVAECTPTPTGAVADHRLAADPDGLLHIAQSLHDRITGTRTAGESLSGPQSRWVDAIVGDLKRGRGRAIVIAGRFQPPNIHQWAFAINQAIGAVGRTVEYASPVEAAPTNNLESICELVDSINAGDTETLLILGGNPVYNAPADLNFADCVEKIENLVHVGLHVDETAEKCHWHIPQTHFLEAWSDTRGHDGTISIVQPLIAPLYGGKSLHEVVDMLLRRQGRSSADIVREYTRSGEETEDRVSWRRALHDGVMPDTTTPAAQDINRKGTLPERQTQRDDGDDAGTLHLVIRPDPTVWDGRYANNGWLQELPKPLTKLTWDNAALVSPALAEQEGLENGDEVELKVENRRVKAPVWITPGQPQRCVTIHLGHGRPRAGRVGDGVGFNAYSLRTSQHPWGRSGVGIRKTGVNHPMACTQDHHSMEGRDIVRSGPLAAFREDPTLSTHAEHAASPATSLYLSDDHEGNAWGMVINLGACIGCNACIVACQAENNIPVVGADQVRLGREMHWIRVDRYYAESIDHPQTLFQPVTCMHCENAPCEVVCPVGATVHGEEGLNEMVYNRCVGTRYCSNNCPYKVRRFNFLAYADFKTPSLKLLHNPDVTVRSRGVMEKCTYCVQRINVARIEAKKENRPIGDGEIVTACQGACPTEAIVFGNINDPESRVSRLRRRSHHYGLLEELNTRPRTTYLARVTNPGTPGRQETGHGS